MSYTSKPYTHYSHYTHLILFIYICLATARYFLSLTSPKIIFAMPSLVPILEEAMKELQMNMKIVVSHKLNGYTSMEDILSGHDMNEIIEFKCAKISNPDDVALISLSSGTTGMPKGTEISHSSLYNCLLPVKVTELEDHTCLWTHTLRWHYGVQLAFHAILAYSTKILAPCSIILNDDDEAICRFIEKYRVSSNDSTICYKTKFANNN